MPEHHDLKLLELPRAGTQRYELEHAAQHQIAERPEQESSPQDQRDGRTTLRPARASQRRNRVNAPHTPRFDWQPTADHYPRLKMHGGRLTPDNVRLGHRLCNRRDYGWRVKINAMLGKRMSLEEIAEKLNVEKVPTIHGTNRWTAASVRKAFAS